MDFSLLMQKEGKHMMYKQRTLSLCEYVPILSMHSDDPDQG